MKKRTNSGKKGRADRDGLSCPYNHIKEGDIIECFVMEQIEV